MNNDRQLFSSGDQGHAALDSFNRQIAAGNGHMWWWVGAVALVVIIGLGFWALRHPDMRSERPPVLMDPHDHSPD